MRAIEAALSRHTNIALQLSGGKDSLACLWLMKPYLDKIRVYWTNHGDPFPETVELMDSIRAWVPHFVEIAGRQPEVIAEHGIPSDLVPASRTAMGLFATGAAGFLTQDRYSCCARSMMLPMHERMLADGITLIIRGQKNKDKLKSTIRSGSIENGIEFLLPVEDWSDDEVLAFLQSSGAPVPRFYQMLRSAPDCLTCSAFLEEGAVKYVKAHHPEAFAIVQRRLDDIAAAVSTHTEAFNLTARALAQPDTNGSTRDA